MEILSETVLSNPFLPKLDHKGQPWRLHRKQVDFITYMGDEAFYGGAAGGGKSESLLVAALQYIHVKGYAALLLRRSFAELSKPGALMDRAEEWLTPHKPRVHWNRETRTWRFPSGATLSFGYLDSENDKYQYNSAEFQFVGFDESTQFTETQYTYLFSRLRRLAGVNIPIRMRSASNPGGEGHGWVKKRFVDPTSPERPFFPAKLEDNPSLDEAAYDKSLERLDPITRAQLRHGDWSDYRGGFFDSNWFRQRQLLAWPDDLHCMVRFWDLAGTKPKKGTDPDWTVGTLGGFRRSNQRFCVCDVARDRGTPGEMKEMIRRTAEADGKSVKIVFEQERGAAGIWLVEDMAKYLAGWYVEGIVPTGDKMVRAGPYSSHAQKGLVEVLQAPWNKEWFDEHDLFPNAAHDDQIDSASGAFEQAAKMLSSDGPITGSSDSVFTRAPRSVVESLPNRQDDPYAPDDDEDEADFIVSRPW